MAHALFANHIWEISAEFVYFALNDDTMVCNVQARTLKDTLTHAHIYAYPPQTEIFLYQNGSYVELLFTTEQSTVR